MRRYAVEDEVRIALDQVVRDWTATGLISPAQAESLRPDLATPLRRTGLMLRLGLAAFTIIAGTAAVGLVALVVDASSEVAVALTAAVLGGVALAAADVLATQYRLYRHGVEEALALGAIGLAGFGAGLLSSAIAGSSSGAVPWMFAMAAVAGVSGVAYRRFGFQYAAVASLIALALLPMGLDSLDLELKRLYVAILCAGVAWVVTAQRRQADDDVRASDLEVVRAAAFVGAYAALNVHLTGDVPGRGVDAWFWWLSWALIWLLPLAAGRQAIVDRDPLLLRVAIAAGLASLVTNKSYLGWARQPWDPMVLGVALVAAALVLRRWLAAGANGERNGFTPRQLVASDDATMQLASVAAVAVQPTPVREVQEPQASPFSGGRSGGAGAGGSF